MNHKTISYSALDTYTRCPYKYHLAYNERLTKNEVEVTPATMGVVIHAGLSYGLLLYHSSDYTLEFEELYDQLEGMFFMWADQNAPDPVETIDEYGNPRTDTSLVDAFHYMVQESFQIVYRTFKHLDVNNNWRTVEWKGKPLIEFRHEVPIIDDVNFVFVIDWVAQDIHSGLTYVVDWKSRRTFQEDENEAAISGEDFNTQITLYQAALLSMGLETNGTITYQIAPYVPKVPEKLQNSDRFSRANIRSDWETYSNTLRHYGENPDDPYYAEMKDKLSNFKWWSPVTIYRSRHEIVQRWIMAQKWAQRIHSDDQHLKVESVMCRWCPFASICLGEDKGFDVDSIKKNEYTIRQSTITERELLNGN